MSDNRHLDTPIVPQYPGIPRVPLHPGRSRGMRGPDEPAFVNEDPSLPHPGTALRDREASSTGPH